MLCRSSMGDVFICFIYSSCDSPNVWRLAESHSLGSRQFRAKSWLLRHSPVADPAGRSGPATDALFQSSKRLVAYVFLWFENERV